MNYYIIPASILSIIIGYILGSILPAYIIGRIKGIDIRKVGTKNAGTSNVYHELGLSYAVMTGFYDFFKGLLAIWISSLLQENFIIMQLAGYAAIIGHVFPFYINFRGGQGLASSMALLIYYMVNYALYSSDIFVVLLYLLLILILFKVVCKVSNLLTILIYPLLGYSIWIFYPDNIFNIFTWIILGYIVIMAFNNIIRYNQIKINEDLKQIWWKLVLNPVLMILVILYAISPVAIFLILIGVLAITMGFIGFIRHLNQDINDKLYLRIKLFFKETDEKKLLSISIILIAMFLTMLIFSFFNKSIVIAAFTFSLFGSTFNGFFGTLFGKRKLFSKTLEGFIGYTISVLMFTLVLFFSLGLSPFVLLIGGLSVAFLQTLPFKLNENLVVPLVSSFLMSLALMIGF